MKEGWAHITMVYHQWLLMEVRVRMFNLKRLSSDSNDTCTWSLDWFLVCDLDLYEGCS